jgi:hypothetical protein
MDVFIPPEIENCKDEVLKTNALAAIQRGNMKDQNETYLACITFNKLSRQQENLNKRKEEYSKWSKWFNQSI